MRAEDRIEQLKISGPAFGTGVSSRIAFHEGKDLPGFEFTGEREARPMKALLRDGFLE